MARPQKIPDGLKLRGKTYYAWLTYKGQTIRKALSRNKEAASDILNDIIARIDRGEYGFLDNRASLADIRDRYLEHLRQRVKESSAWRTSVCLKAILPKLGVESVDRLREEVVESYRRLRLEAGRSPRTINMEVGALQSMLRYAVRNEIIAKNPIAGLKRLPHDNPREGRALTDHEVAALLEASPPLWRDIFYAYLVTGLRKMELVNLRWRDIDFEAREIVVRATNAKNRTARRIPMDDGLWKILKRLEAKRDSRLPGKGKTPKITEIVQKRFTKDHVFVTIENTPLTHRHCVYGAFRRCCRSAGIEVKTVDDAGNEIDHVDVHSLRRTFATNLITGGADPKSVQDLMGHKTLAMTMNLYAKIHTSTRRQALAKLSYGQGASQPDGFVAGPVRMMNEPKAHKMRTNGEPVAVAST